MMDACRRVARSRGRYVTIPATCLWMTAWGVCLGDQPGLARIYGTGIHAYHVGDAARAYADLTQVIEAGSRDPRSWYFRGLAAARLGRFDEAEADFTAAAAREAAGDGDWGVGRSLERVQGRDRVAIERHRIRAEITAASDRRRPDERRSSGVGAPPHGGRDQLSPPARKGTADAAFE